jgi:hypothetical protein
MANKTGAALYRRRIEELGFGFSFLHQLIEHYAQHWRAVGYAEGRAHERHRRAASCRQRYAANRGRCACGRDPCPFKAGVAEAQP